MTELLSININEAELKELCKQRIEVLIKEADAELVFWDTKELLRRTCMSWNFIQEQFFFDPRMPKYKIGTKWYYPARETREFLETWLVEQNNRRISEKKVITE